VDGPGRTIIESGVRMETAKFGYFIGAFCNTNGCGNSFLDAAIKRGLRAFSIDETISFDPTVFLQIRRLIRENAVDIIHTHEVRSDMIGLACGRMHGIPVITTLHGWIQNDVRGRFSTGIDKRILRFFNHVICVSKLMNAECIRMGVKKENISVLHNSLVNEKFRRNPDDQSFRSEIGAGPRTILVGNIGRLSPEKGQTDFIRSARTVLNYHKDTRFVLVGKGEDQPMLEDLAFSLGIRAEVLFVGYRENMRAVYNSLDLVVQSSYTEGLPNVILEALSMEVPVIATDVGGTSEIVLNNSTGVKIQPGKPEEIGAKILDFIKNKDTFKRMAEQGRKVVEAGFSIDERTRKLSLIYDRLISAM